MWNPAASEKAARNPPRRRLHPPRAQAIPPRAQVIPLGAISHELFAGSGLLRVFYTATVIANLVFITGGSSGIGAAMARVVPYSDARVINISRRALPGTDHYQADLSD